MKTATTALAEYLASTNEYRMADLYDVTLVDGTSLHLTSADFGVTFGTTLYAAAPPVKRGKTRLAIGLDVDTLDVTIQCGQGAQLYGVSMQLAAHNGAFDGARVKLQRAFFAGWDAPAIGAVLLFEGLVALATPSSTSVKLSVKSELYRLASTKLPRNLFQPGCANTLYDSGCGLARSSYQASGVVASGAGTYSLPTTGLSQPDGYYALGTLTMTSGAAAGATRSVNSFVGGTIALAIALPVAPAAGDTFSVWPGCPHDTATCQARFNNLPRYRGFPYVPRAEEIL
jgi:uncharacterized phage protein (TIGR02218 family)